MTRYRLIDNQEMISPKEKFNSKEEIRQHLINFHQIDADPDVDLNKYSLQELLVYGDWSMQKRVKGVWVDV